MLFSIGEFSRITLLSVKTLRFYHDQGLLAPRTIDPRSGYRYYDESQVERARVIVALKNMGFPLEEVKEVLAGFHDDQELLDSMERRLADLEHQIRRLRSARRSISQFIEEERRLKTMSSESFNVEERDIAPLLIAGVRMRGCYGDCGKGFGKIARSFGRNLNGKPMLLHYSSEYSESDADFEAAIPVKPVKKSVEGINVREIEGGHFVCLVHKGPYEELGRSYQIITKYIHDKGYKGILPSREIYIKGPGMIFRGNPKNYLTEIQIGVEK